MLSFNGVRLEAGMKVLMKEEWGDTPPSPSERERMDPFLGKIVTIRKIDPYYRGFYISEDMDLADVNLWLPTDIEEVIFGDSSVLFEPASKEEIGKFLDFT